MESPGVTIGHLLIRPERRRALEGMPGFKGFLFWAILLCPLPVVFSGAGECRTRTLDCYDCDSRYDENCLHVDKTNLTADKPKITSCEGCCVKFYHNFPGKDPYVQRTCTQRIVINYFMVDHVCMNEGRQHGRMCFCEDNLCNRSSRRHAPWESLLSSFLLIPMTSKLLPIAFF